MKRQMATGPTAESVPAVSILGVKVSQLTVPELLSTVDETIREGRRAQVLNANAHGINLAYEQSWFRDIYNQSDYVLCDGFGVKWGARLLGQMIPARLTPPDWLFDLAKLSAERGFTMAFLGNKRGVGERAAERLMAAYPNLRATAIYHGYFDKTLGGPANEYVVGLINAARPNILLVGFGMPVQERWLAENWDRLRVNIAVTVGAMPDYIAGAVPRGPRWMTDYGLEWLARLVTEPRRLWRRYVIGIPIFLARVTRQRFGMLPPEKHL